MKHSLLYKSTTDINRKAYKNNSQCIYNSKYQIAYKNRHSQCKTVNTKLLINHTQSYTKYVAKKKEEECIISDTQIGKKNICVRDRATWLFRYLV